MLADLTLVCIAKGITQYRSLHCKMAILRRPSPESSTASIQTEETSKSALLGESLNLSVRKLKTYLGEV
jgi:hypothetical protein